MASYRVQYTERKPGGAHADQDVSVRGTLQDVRDYVDAQRIADWKSIKVTEHLTSDSAGRVVSANEWDVPNDDA